MVHVAVLHLELFLPLAHSLKDKRSVLQRVLSRIRNRHAVAVAEVDHQELWQRAALAVVAVSAKRLLVEQCLQRVLEDIEEIGEEFELCGSAVEWR
jgi:uncharacterized protein YlxP (DUF503 family)